MKHLGGYFFVLVCLWFGLGQAAETKDLHFSNSCKSSTKKELSTNPRFLRIVNEYVEMGFRDGKGLSEMFGEEISLKRLLEISLNNRGQLLREIEDLLLYEKEESNSSKILRVALEKLEQDLEANIESLEHKLQRVDSNQSLKEAFSKKQEDSSVERFLDNIAGFQIKPRAVLAETLVGLEASTNISALEAHVGEMLAKARPELYKKLKGHRGFEAARELEMDVVSSNYKTWIEVKTIQAAHPKRLARLVDSLTAKAIKVSNLIQLIRKLTGERHYFQVVIFGPEELPEDFMRKMDQLNVGIEIRPMP